MMSVRILVAVLLTSACFWSGLAVCQRLVAGELFRVDPSPAGILRALEWDPQMPDLYFQLGLCKRDLPEAQDLRESVSNLERAVSLNPHRWDYVNELGRGYELAGRDDEAVRLYAESVRLNPRSALYHWRLANYYLRTNGLGGSLPTFRAALALDSSYVEPAVRLLSHAGATCQHLLAICPAELSARLTLLEILETEDSHPPDLIDGLWQQVLTSNPPPSPSDGAFHVDYLQRQDRFEEARKEWINLCRMNRIADEAFERKANFVWNGDFELPVFGVGLDWKVSLKQNQSVRLAEGEGVSGSTALRIDFDGNSNPDLVMIRQTVLLRTGSEHELRFRSRSRSLTSDRGLYLQVVDQANARPLGTSVEIRGTRDWEEEVIRIPASASSRETRAVQLVLKRDRSWKIDGNLAGSLWLDDVTIR